MTELTNPLATPDQREVEDRAMALLERPELQRARTVVTMLWDAVTAWPARDQADRIPNMIDEYMFHHAIRAANGDAANPKAVRFMVPKHHWFGRDVPGSRWAGDSPDFVYRTIPITHGGRYVIEGRPSSPVPHTVNYSLMSDNTAAPVTQFLLDSLDMEIGSDGSFVVTVDETPPDGRPNHIQTKPGAEFIMVRDALGDWSTQSANILDIRQLDSAEAMSEDAMAQRAAKIAIEGMYYTYYCTQSGGSQPPNEVRQPMSSAAFGGMATQAGAKGNLALDPDQAMIVRCNSAGANFRNVTLTDAFHMTIEYWKRTSTFNMTQMAADEDGDFTFVVAHQDPGVHNWLDTGGLRRVIYGQRWQAFDRATEHDAPWIDARLVKFDDLERELPAGVKRIDSAERANQIAARQAGFDRRFVEN